MSDSIPPPQVSDEKETDAAKAQKLIETTRARMQEAIQSIRDTEQKQSKVNDERAKLLEEHDKKVVELANLQATLLSFVSFEKK